MLLGFANSPPEHTSQPICEDDKDLCASRDAHGTDSEAARFVCNPIAHFRQNTFLPHPIIGSLNLSLVLLTFVTVISVLVSRFSALLQSFLGFLNLRLRIYISRIFVLCQQAKCRNKVSEMLGLTAKGLFTLNAPGFLF